jgi:hypothetical protein
MNELPGIRNRPLAIGVVPHSHHSWLTFGAQGTDAPYQLRSSAEVVRLIHSSASLPSLASVQVASTANRSWE